MSGLFFISFYLFINFLLLPWSVAFKCPFESLGERGLGSPPRSCVGSLGSLLLSAGCSRVSPATLGAAQPAWVCISPSWPAPSPCCPPARERPGPGLACGGHAGAGLTPGDRPDPRRSVLTAGPASGRRASGRCCRCPRVSAEGQGSFHTSLT